MDTDANRVAGWRPFTREVKGKFYPFDPDLFDQCLLVLISGSFFCGI